MSAPTHTKSAAGVRAAPPATRTVLETAGLRIDGGNAPSAAPRAAEEGILRLRNAAFRYDPYPIGVVHGVCRDDDYAQMLECWPDQDDFKFMPTLGKKYSLSELNNPGLYHRAIRSTPIWRRVYDEVKSPAFIHRVLDVLLENHIDLDLKRRGAIVNRAPWAPWRRLVDAWRGFRLQGAKSIPLKSRFEFSMLPADGGHIKPHTDGMQKYITLVVSVVRPGEWDEAWGGGTQVLKARNMALHGFNYINTMLPFDTSEEIGCYDFRPNQCVLFVKTFNSLHAVAPMTGHNTKAMRKTLTINIESPRT